MNQQPLPQAEPVFLVETDKIVANPYQPRRHFDEEKLKDLANSIRELGILQPLVVTKVEEDSPQGLAIRYELIAGERRLRASRMLGLARVPAIVKNVKLDQHRLEMAIVENVQRADLNAIEAAKAYNRLQDEFGLTQREIASRVGKSRASIANTMRLLSLPSEIQEAVGSGKVSESQARLLMTIEDPQGQSRLFKDILFRNLSVRELKNEIEKYKRDARVPQKQSMFSRDPVALNLQRALEEFLGADVRLDSSGESGKITIRFQSKEELQAIVEKMTSHESPDTHQTVSDMYERTQQTDVSDMMGLDSSLSEQEPEPVREEPIQAENSFDMSDVVAPPAVQSEMEDTFHATEKEHEDALPMEQPEHDILASYGFGGEEQN